MSIGEIRNISLIAVIGIIAAGIFAAFSSPLSGLDPVQYDRLGYNIASGNGFSTEEKPPFLPTMFREPAYPAFLALIYTIFGHNVKFVIAIQILLHALSAMITYYLAKEAFSEKCAALSGMIVAVFPTLANIASYIMSETFFTALLCLCIYLVSKALKKKSGLLFLASGIIFGILTLTKTASLFLPFAMAFPVFLAGRKNGIGMKRAAYYVAALILPFLLVVSAWSIRNHNLFATRSLALRGGEVIWSRAEKLDDSPQEILATACCSFSEFLGKRLFPHLVDRPERYLYKDLERAIKLKDEYEKKGLTAVQADNILEREGLAKISQHPFKYLLYTPVEAIKMTAFTYLPILNEPFVRTWFGGIQSGKVMLSLSRGMIRMLAYPILLFFFAAMIKYFRIWDRWLPLFMVIAYYTLVYSLMDAIGRYGVPLIPFYCIFVAAFFCNGREPAS